MKADQEKIAKLPQWAQEHIRSLERERETALSNLHEWCDAQTPSPVSIYELLSTGEERGPTRYVRYIQTNSVQFNWEGVELDVTLRDGLIDIRWGGKDGRTMDICFQPRSFQQAHLFIKEHMR